MGELPTGWASDDAGRPASALERASSEERAELERQGRLRALPLADAAGIDFTSNDYLGLARDPRLAAAAIEAVARAGSGGRASRLLGGGGALHRAAEAAAAEWLGAEAALLFPSGYQANLTLIATLARRGDAIVSDALVHASLVDATRLSRAKVRVHAHGDLADLERALVAARSARRRWVLTEGVFSMDGDRVDLAGIAQLCARHDAWLIIDEAHAAGLIGPEGRGAWAELEKGLPPASRARLAARVVTGGKALGAAGAFVVGPRAVLDALVQRGRGFVYSTAPQPALAATLTSAIAIVRAEDERREACLANARRLAEGLGLAPPAAAIVPWIVGDERAATDAAAELARRGFDVRAVRPPTVPADTSRLRFVARAEQRAADVDALSAACRAARLPRALAPRISAPAPDPLFVVGTDTGVGKTVVAALAVAALRAHGPVAYWKPIQTGAESDTDAVRRLARASADELLEPAAVFALPASPHEAAAAEERRVPGTAELERTLDAFAARRPDARLVVELAGGLLVPYDDARTQADWVAERSPPVLLVARAGLGTLNHTLLTAEALERRRITPLALVLVGEPHASNRATLRARLGIPVLELEPLVIGAGALELEREPLARFVQRLGELAAAALPRTRPGAAARP